MTGDELVVIVWIGMCVLGMIFGLCGVVYNIYFLMRGE
jgi:hypothetical protein